MFGIGLPELLVIMALALIVVGPEKLPGLAKTIARQLVEFKKAAASLQDSLKEETADKSWEEEFRRGQEFSRLPPATPSEGEVPQSDEEERIFDEVRPAAGPEDITDASDQQSDQK